MSDTPVIPAWAQIVSMFGTPLIAAFTFVIGRASKEGGHTTEFKQIKEKVVSMETTLNDTVVTVSNHGQAQRYFDGRLNDVEGKLNTANTGIATLLERTKKL